MREPSYALNAMATILLFTLPSVCVAAVSAATQNGLTDVPIATAVPPQYFDGDGWTASTPATATLMTTPSNVHRRAGDGSMCDFVPGRRYNASSVGQTPAVSADDCCTKCDAASNCAAAVFVGPNGTCQFKQYSDVVATNIVPAPHDVVACMLKFYEPAPSPAPVPAVSMRVPARVPGDVVTDLQRAGKIGDPWRELNWIHDSHLWNGANGAWSYSHNFSLATTSSSPPPSSSTYLLVFDGVKMGAEIYLNGQLLGEVSNQFIRYVFPINSSVLRVGEDDGSNDRAVNHLVVKFNDSIPLEDRFMACLLYTSPSPRDRG